MGVFDHDGRWILPRSARTSLTWRKVAGKVEIADGYGGEAYGVPTPEMQETLRLLAHREGLVLDPVYTGKAMAALIGLVREGRFEASRAVVFIHTGGLPGLFSYPSLFPPGLPAEV